MAKSFAQIKAIEAANKGRIKKACPNASENSGIYILTREEGGFKFCYVGQAKNLLQRLAGHLSGYEQKIDRSLKKHKLWSIDNLGGYRIAVRECEVSELDELEQAYILSMHKAGYQLQNKTSGSQGDGKFALVEYQQPKGYRDGVAAGYDKAVKEIGEQIHKYTTGLQSKNGKIAERKTAELIKLFKERLKTV